jgi:hypothetical protein
VSATLFVVGFVAGVIATVIVNRYGREQKIALYRAQALHAADDAICHLDTAKNHQENPEFTRGAYEARLIVLKMWGDESRRSLARGSYD